MSGNNRQTSSPARKAFSLILNSVLVLMVAACAKGGGSRSPFESKTGSNESPAAEGELSLTTTTVLPEDQKIYQVYKIVDTKVEADASKRTIVARVVVKSSDGTDLVVMGGKIREDGSATLMDTEPYSPTEHRLVAEAQCVDTEKCTQIILDVYYKVGEKGELVKQQFVPESLKNAPTASEEPGDKNEIPDNEEVLDHGDENDENNEQTSKKFLGEFVGASRNNGALERLWVRPETPEAEEEIEPTTIERKDPRPRVPGPNAENPVEVVQPEGTTQPAVKEPVKHPAKQPVAPSKRPKREPRKERRNVVIDIPDAPDKEAAAPRENPVPERFRAWLNLDKGGRARGQHMRGSLENGTQMPKRGDNFRQLYTDRDTLWASGLMASVLENSALFLKKHFPGVELILGDISKRGGGQFNSRHVSHQNGLDADIPYIGYKSFVLAYEGSGKMRSDFDFKKTWGLWMKITQQTITTNSGKQTTVLNRIFVNPIIKRNFCTWARNQKGFYDIPLNRELMKRIRPTSGHNKHFHLRLRCSPFYPACRDQVEPPNTTGC